MNESIMEIRRLIQEIVAHLNSGTKTDARKAIAGIHIGFEPFPIG